jgi:hypothetical protein
VIRCSSFDIHQRTKPYEKAGTILDHKENMVKRVDVDIYQEMTAILYNIIEPGRCRSKVANVMLYLLILLLRASLVSYRYPFYISKTIVRSF